MKCLKTVYRKYYMAATQRIYITGFMGAGKSTVAPRVAKKLQYDCVDLDEQITTKLGMSAPAIFDVLGEPVFREEEKACLLDSSRTTNIVISLGGGTLTQEDNLSRCLASGFLIYLKASAAFLAHRLSQSRQTRPLLFGPQGNMLEGAELEARIQHLLTQRKSVYERAHKTIEIDGVEATQVVKLVLDAVRHR